MSSLNTQTDEVHRDLAPESLPVKRLLTMWAALTTSVLLISTAQYTPQALTLQMKLSEIDAGGAATAIGAIVAVAMLAACLFGPVAGRLSDRTRSRFGMRRPWIVGGVILGGAGTAIIAFTTDARLVGVGWTIATIGYSVANLIPVAMLAEQVPDKNRGLFAFGLAGAGGISAAIGAALVPLFGASLTWPILIPAIAAVILVPALLALVPDRRLLGNVEPLTTTVLMSSYWTNPRGRRPFITLLVTMFLVNFGYIVFSTYLYFVLLINNEVSEQDAPAVIASISAVGGVLFLAAGAAAAFISDKTQRRKGLLVGATSVLAAAMLAQAFVVGIPIVLALASIQYAMSGVIFTLGFVLLSEVTTADTAGRDAGMYNTVITLAAVAGPFLASILLLADPTNLSPIFIMVTAVTIIGAGFVGFSKHLK